MDNLDLSIKTDLPFNTPVYYDVKPPNAYCQNYLGTQRVKLDIEICGLEDITVLNPDKEYDFWATYNEDYNLKITNLTDDFSSSSNFCLVNRWELWSSR